MLPSLVDGVIVIFKNRPRRCQSPARLGTTIENVGDVGVGAVATCGRGGGLKMVCGYRCGRKREEEVWYHMVCCGLRRDGENTRI